jgi:hypothetical protein
MEHPNPFDEFLKETLKGRNLISRGSYAAFLKEAGTIIQMRKFLKWYYIPVL